MDILKLFLISILLLGVRCQEEGFGSYEFESDEEFGSFEESREIVGKGGQVLPEGISVNDLKTNAAKAMTQLVAELIVKNLQQNWPKSNQNHRADPIHPFISDHICINATNNPLNIPLSEFDLLFEMLSDFEITGLDLVNAALNIGLEQDDKLNMTIGISYTINVPSLNVLGDFSWRLENRSQDSDPVLLFEMGATESELNVNNSNFKLILRADVLPINDKITFQEISINYKSDSSWLAYWKLCIINETEEGSGVYECKSLIEGLEQPFDLSLIIDPILEPILTIISAILKDTFNWWFQKCTVLDLLSGSLDCITPIFTSILSQIMEQTEEWTLGYQECPAMEDSTSEDPDDTTTDAIETTTSGAETFASFMFTYLTSSLLCFMYKFM